MSLIKPLLLITKNLILLGLVVVAIARIFFPQKFEDSVVTPSNRMPVFGKVLGITWDTAGDVTDLITNKTVSLADEIETNDLNIDEKISQISQSENPKTEASKLIEESINKKVEDLKNLPKEKLNQIKDQLRKEMYNQICTELASESTASSQ